ncbi:energy-coupling factor ABC transporter ATP-binding protein [Sulfurospirillum arcachonense]|uniref:energy-coupling factor ABC transporter ATP-binding protein n=1 Tax=Sulfurospirillum arcachonense TaxID=57666 RepID=UPI0004688586|nr:ABC transporter ATP-binding protein [Sulfurospirillum arcachonense]
MSCSVTLKKLSYENGGNNLCKDINLNVSHKEKIAIIGPNGCGKTTLLDIIAGLKQKDSGLLELFHNKIENEKDFKPMRDLIGYLFQNSDNQFLAPIVIDDVAFSLLSAGIKKEKALLKANMMLDDLGIIHLKEKIVYNLSGGEKKLVALAGVLVTEPRLMLLDEPTNGLDYKMQLKLVEILKKIDKSIIIVSHNREFIDSIVDKIYEITPNGLVLIESLSDRIKPHSH